MKIIDDFLEEKEFEELHSRFMGDIFPWFFCEEIDSGILNLEIFWPTIVSHSVIIFV